MPKKLLSTIQVCIILLAAASITSSIVHFVTVVNTPGTGEQVYDPTLQANGSTAATEIITNAHLFGSSENMQAKLQPDLDKIINDTLDLKGISSQPGGEGYNGAYIAEKGQVEVFYPVGAALPAGLGIVEEVTTDYVSIKKDGKSGRLHFPKQDNIIQDIPLQY